MRDPKPVHGICLLRLGPRRTLLFFHFLVLRRLLDKTTIDQIVSHVYYAALCLCRLES